MEVASGTDRHLEILLFWIACTYIVESPSLISVRFREVFSHPYISFFHLLVNVSFCYK